nr:integrase, catalytic region, zinc finger, CCHC-type, peptidase aspartic, catalytic [Tanacetum cinerariifolium]
MSGKVLDLEFAFRRNISFVRNLEGVDPLKGNRTPILYTINLREIAFASPICLMDRATSTKSWLSHERLSHLNFDTINDLAKNDLVTGLPKYKYHKEHLLPSYIPNTSQDVDELQQHDQKQDDQVKLQREVVSENVPYAMVDGNTFVDLFAPPSTNFAESSSQYVDLSDMHTFYQPYQHDYQWTKDHPPEQVIVEPS